MKFIQNCLKSYVREFSSLGFESKHSVFASAAQVVLAMISVVIAFYIFVCQIRLQERQQAIQDDQYKQQKWEDTRQKVIEEATAEFSLAKASTTK